MPDSWKPQAREVYLRWVDFILCHGKDVTPWEQNFTKDLQKQLAKPYNHLSQRQAEILERIYTEKT